MLFLIVILPLLTCPAREWLQIDTDLLRVITSTADELSGGTTSMTLNDLEAQNRGFSELFAISGCETHFNSELRRNHWR